MATRVDSWVWAIRLTKTRSAAGAACRAGHVEVNGVTAKPSAPVSIGDRVSVRLGSRLRIVEVTGLISKRGSAAVAAENHIDHSPPPPPREVLASIPRRDPGAGRPTKRERRQLDRLRSGTLMAALAVVALLLAGCGGDDNTAKSVNETPAPRAGTGPDFEQCAGLDTEQVLALSGLPGLRPAIENPATCEWRTGTDRASTVSVNWYRGSPIGRERGHVQLSRDLTQDLEIGGQHGFIAHSAGICEIGLAWDADYIQISVSAYDPARRISVDQLCAGAKRLGEAIVKGAS